MTLTIRLDTTDLLAASERIGALDMQMLRRVREDAVAAVSLSVRKQAVDETFRSLNVTRDYIEQRLERKTGRREGLLTQDLVISPVRGTTLQRFGAQVPSRGGRTQCGEGVTHVLPPQCLLRLGGRTPARNRPRR